MAPTSKAFVTVLLSLALCQITAAEPSLEGSDLEKRTVEGIKEISHLSDQLRKHAEDINKDTATSVGLYIPLDIGAIRAQFNKEFLLLSLSGKNTLNNDSAKVVVETLKKLVETHWAPSIKVVQSKHKIRELGPFIDQILSSLWLLKDRVISYEFALVTRIPTRQSDARKLFDTLKKEIDESIKIYESIELLTPRGDSPVEAIQEALTTFLQAQRALLNVLIGNRGITTYAGDLA